jgi:hypothetical protein
MLDWENPKKNVTNMVSTYTILNVGRGKMNGKELIIQNYSDADDIKIQWNFKNSASPSKSSWNDKAVS